MPRFINHPSLWLNCGTGRSPDGLKEQVVPAACEALIWVYKPRGPGRILPCHCSFLNTPAGGIGRGTGTRRSEIDSNPLFLPIAKADRFGALAATQFGGQVKRGCGSTAGVGLGQGAQGGGGQGLVGHRAFLGNLTQFI